MFGLLFIQFRILFLEIVFSNIYFSRPRCDIELECARRSTERELLLLAILFQFLTKITIVPQSLCRRNEKPSICLRSKPFARAEETDGNQCQIVVKHWNYSYSHRTEKTLEFDLKWSSSALSFDRFYLLFFRLQQRSVRCVPTSLFLSQFHFKHCIYHKSCHSHGGVHQMCICFFFLLVHCENVSSPFGWELRVCALCHTVEPHKFTYGNRERVADDSRHSMHIRR